MASGFNSRTIHLSSKYVDNPNGGTQNVVYDGNGNPTYTFVLNQTINIPQEYELYVSVLTASVPVSWYATPNTTIGYTKGTTLTPWGIYNTTSLLYTGTIPAGNYSVGSGSSSDLMLLMGGTLNTAHVDINMTFSLVTGLLTFKNINPSGTTTQNNANTIVVGPIPLLGITSPLTIAPQASATAQATPDIYGTRYVNIVTSLATNNITAGYVPRSGGSVLLSIPVNASPFTILTYTPNQLLKNRLKESTINSIQVSLADSDMNPLNLNGATFELDLLVECVIPPNMPQEYSQEPQGVSIYALNRNYKYGKL